jgi:hypothetical protein
MFDALAEDIEAFADSYGRHIEFSRLAVTSRHVDLYDLPTAPPKPSTHQQRKHMTETTQAEALDPAALADIVRDGIESRMDLGVYRHVVKTEARERAALVGKFV